MNYVKESFVNKNVGPEQLDGLVGRIEDVLGGKHPVFEALVGNKKIQCASVYDLLRVLDRGLDSGDLVQEISDIQETFRMNFELTQLARSENNSNYLIYAFEKKGIPLFSNTVGELLKVCVKDKSVNLEELLVLIEEKAKRLDGGHLGELLKIWERGEEEIDLAKLFALLERKTEKLDFGHVNCCFNCVIKSKDPEKYKEQLRVYRDNLLKEELIPKNSSVILKVSWFLGDLEQLPKKEEIEETYRKSHSQIVKYENIETTESFLRLIEEIELLDYRVGAIKEEYLLPGVSVDRMMVVEGVPLYFEWDYREYHRNGGKSENGWDVKTKAQRELFKCMKIPMFYFSEKDWKSENFVRFQVLLDEFLEKHASCEQ